MNIKARAGWSQLANHPRRAISRDELKVLKVQNIEHASYWNRPDL